MKQSGALSLVESFIELKFVHGVATPALLCQKEPARSKQNTPQWDELVLYDIRELA